jgi:hypothetical protein
MSNGTLAPAATPSQNSVTLTRFAEFAPFFHPINAQSNQYIMFYALFNQLIKLDLTDESLQKYVPDLAEKWTVSPDGTSYTFNLRKDVKWHDGTKFTADDVVYTATWGAENQGAYIGFKPAWFSIKGAQAAEAAIKLGGIYDGTETPKEINAMTKAAAAAHKGRGLMGVARDNLPRDGQTYGFMAAFAEVEVDIETGVWTIVDFTGVADVGTVIHRTRSAGGSTAAASGHRSRSQPEAGVRPALWRRTCDSHAPQQAADDSRRAHQCQVGRRRVARSDQPGRRQGHR